MNENNRVVYSVTPNSEDDYQEDDVVCNFDDESALKDLGVNVGDEDEDDDARPFRLSDLAVEYSTDSGPQSEPETDDSRPVSRLGSSNSRTVYLDRSGGATSEDLAESTNDFVTDTPELLGVDDKKIFRPKSTFRDLKVYTPDDEKLSDKEMEPVDVVDGEQKVPAKDLRNSDDCLLSRRLVCLGWLSIALFMIVNCSIKLNIYMYIRVLKC